MRNLGEFRWCQATLHFQCLTHFLCTLPSQSAGICIHTVYLCILCQCLCECECVIPWAWVSISVLVFSPCRELDCFPRLSLAAPFGDSIFGELTQAVTVFRACLLLSPSFSQPLAHLWSQKHKMFHRGCYFFHSSLEEKGFSDMYHTVESNIPDRYNHIYTTCTVYI